MNFEELIAKKKNRIILKVLGLFLGVFLGWFVVFQVLFLYRVLPHGGL